MSIQGESRVWAADTLFAAAVAAVSLAFAIPHVTASVLALALSASLVVRRSVPALALAVASVAAVAHALLLPNLTVSIVAIPVLVYSIARWSGGMLSWTALGIALAGAVAGPVLWLAPRIALHDVLVTVAAYAGVVVAAYIFGQRERERAETQFVRRRLERITDQQNARISAAEERTEIAREVHDIVAHSLSMIAVQAEGGRALVTRSPERAPEILSVIADESRHALNEIRDMVTLLRRGCMPSPWNFRPSPDIGNVRELVGRLGDRARLHIVGEYRSIGPVLGLSVYRVIQESLTNFLRHAGPSASVEVIVAVGERTADVIVRDDGRGDDAVTDGKGHGLATMRERVLARGGTMTAGPLIDGGYEVHAVFPVEPGT